MNSRHVRLDRDAVLDALQDQIDDLTAVLAAQREQLDRQRRIIEQLTAHTGLPVERIRER